MYIYLFIDPILQFNPTIRARRRLSRHAKIPTSAIMIYHRHDERRDGHYEERNDERCLCLYM